MSDPAFMCTAWGSDALPDTYLLVDREQGLEAVPQDLLERFREPREVTSFVLGRERKLARADAEEVISSIRERGYYLQLPPPRDAHMSAVANRNEKLAR